MRCEAKSKQSGEQCKRHAVPGKRVCAMHGGKSLAGIASRTFKTGRYSKYLPANLVEKYQEALQDSNLESLNSELALINARIAHVLSSIPTSEIGETWRRLRQVYESLRHAMNDENAVGTIQALQEMGDLITQGLDEYQRWKEVYELVELRRRLSETERRRLVDMQQYMTSQQAMVLVGTLLGIIKARVDDRNILAAIQHDINTVLATTG